MKVVPIDRAMSTPPAEDDESKTPSFIEFTQNTTIHGVRYIFKHTHLIRRCLWVLAVLGSIALFVLQVTLRIQAYLRYDTNVDVQVYYSTAIDFPVVTLCNQNSYRLSWLHRYDLYDFLNEYYTDSEFDVSVYDSAFSNVTTTQLYMGAAHQLRDLIDSCSWNSKPCDIQNDFIAVLTDVGVCYSFNSDINKLDYSQANSEGIGSSLELMLNLEQYEYTRGPQNDAGLKILLHSREEVPVMNDKAVAASPGTHTLMAVNQQQVELMDDPYGICVKSASSISLCKLRCKAKYVQNYCGCVEPYITSILPEYTNVCNVTRTFGCAIKRSQSSYNSEDDVEILKECQCDIPCTETKFTPIMSYAEMAKKNINRTVLQHDYQRSRVKQQFEKAIDIQHHVIPEFYEQDEEYMNATYEEYLDTRYLLNITITVYEYPAILSQRNQYANILGGHHNYVEEDYLYFKNQVNNVRTVANDVVGAAMDDVTKDINALWTMFKPAENAGVDHVANCFSSEQAYIDGALQCQLTALSILMNPYPATPVPSVHSTMETLREKYAALSTITYNTSNQDVMDAHRNCQDTLDWYASTGRNVADDLYELFDNVKLLLTTSDDVGAINSSIMSIRELLATSDGQRLLTTFQSTQYNENSSTQSVYLCYILPEDIIQKSDVFVNKLQQIYESLLSSYNNLISAHDSQLTALRNLQEYLINPGKLYIISLDILEYSGELITKLELAARFKSYTTEVNTFEGDVLDYDYLRNTFKDHADTTRLHTQRMIDLVTAFNVQLLSMDNLNDTVLGSLIEMHRSAERYLSIYDLDIDFNTIYNLLIKEHFKTLTDNYDYLSNGLIAGGAQLVGNIQQLTNSLNGFVLDNTMDQQFYINNFVKIGVYYPELSYTITEQKPAFELGSLLSEVGGFLGLLLGASVLTVCELLDYIGMLIVSRFTETNYTFSD